jgi:hypothetical protein
MIKEGLDYGEKILVIKDFLDKNFQRGHMTKTDENGEPFACQLVVRLDQDGKPSKSMTDVQLFRYLQAKFKDILPESERDMFLKNVIKAWYDKKITRNGSLLNN